MKAPCFSCFVFLTIAAARLCAQSHPGGGGGNTGTTRAPGIGRPTLSLPSTAPGPTSVFVSGKVLLDDGAELTEPAAIQLICRGDHHTRTYTDRHGGFSFQLGDPSPSAIADLSDASASSMTRDAAVREQRNWRECQLQAVLAGFSSEIVELSSRMNSMESTDVGKLMLHRLQQVEGSSISVTSALAPGDARKALEKARDEEKKGKLDESQRLLQKAVQIYPKYASAWFELGQVQMLKKDPISAKASFEQSVAADPKYVNPYNRLAQLAFEAKQWPQVIEITNKLLALNSVDFPIAYFFNSVANYYSNNLDAAEKSARQGIKVDDGHQVDKLYYVLGMVLLQKRDYAHASAAMEQYLHLAKQPAEVDQAKKQLEEISRLSAAASSAEVKK